MEVIFIEKNNKNFVKENKNNSEDYKTLNLLLNYCLNIKNSNEICNKLLKDFGNLNLLFSSTPEEIMNKSKVSEIIAVFLSLQGEIIKRYNNGIWDKKQKLNNSKIIGEYAIYLLSYEIYECFYVISLDSQKRLLNSNIIAEGSVNEVHIYPRLVIECALKNKASYVIIAHNHPGGGINPSFNDIETTHKIIQVLKIIDIYVIDHIIVADNKYFSFYENNLI